MTRWMKWLGRLAALLSILWTIAGPSAAQSAGSDWDGRPLPIAEIAIQIHDPFPTELDWSALGRALLDLQEGQVLTPARLEQAQAAIAPLAQVRSNVAVRPDGLRLAVDITPYRQIKAIDIEGNYPLLERDVRTAMTMVAGDIFDPSRMPAEQAAIAQRFREEGYVAPRVEITWQQDLSDGHYQVRVAIDKGPYRTLKDIRLRGNQRISDLMLKARMTTWRRSLMRLGSIRFKERQVREDVRNLVDYYRSQGFADVRIDTRVSPATGEHHVVSEWLIDEGPLYVIHFSGNQFFSDKTLRKDLVLLEAGNRGNMGIRRTVNKIRRRYLAAGFADIQVDWEERSAEEDSANVRALGIVITEGLRHIVARVAIDGHARLSAEKIRGQMLTRTAHGLGKGVYVADVFQEDLAAILALYRSRGFLEAQVTEKVDIDPQTASVDIALHIAEGVQTLVDTVSVEGQAPRDTQALKQELQLTPGTPYTPIKLQEDENALAARISPLGYPHVQASGMAQLSADSTRADIVYALDPGPSVDVGQVFFVGNLKTRTTFMRREFSLTAGEPFVLSKILEAQRDLRNLDIFDSVQVHTIGLKEKDSTVDMVIRLVEKRPYYFVAGAGYQTDKGFYGRTQIGDHNFTGTAKDLWLKGELSQVGYRAEAGVSDPRWLGTSISAHASAFSERSEPFNQDFGTDILGARLSFSRRWKQRLTTGLGVRFESREQYLRGVSASTVLTEPGDLDPRAVFVVIPTVLYDSRDSFIRPVKGLYTSAAVEISNGLDNALDDFLKYRFELRGYHALSSRVTLAGRVWVGYLAPYGGADPALDQLFFLGGTNTVRGFKENMLRFDAAGDSVGGRLAIAGGLEARIALGKNIELTPFVDTGSVQQSLIDAGSDAFRWSTGLGLQYITPIGPIGLFYGHKLDRRSGESAGQWHLSVGYTF